MHGQTRLKPCMQRCAQLCHLAGGGKGRDGDDPGAVWRSAPDVRSIVCASEMAATLNRKTQRTARNAGGFCSIMPALFAVVLRVGDLFHPCNVFPVECARNGDMRHGGGGGGAVPILPPVAAHQITSPAVMSSSGPPHACVRPTPAVTIRCCPVGCMCQADLAPGSKVTDAPARCAASLAGNRGSTRTFPVKNSQAL